MPLLSGLGYGGIFSFQTQTEAVPTKKRHDERKTARINILKT
jgi:hypothetical protein